MRARPTAILIALLMLTGCLPRQVVVHDGIRASVVDADTKAAISGAFVYDRLDAGQPRVLARSDADGGVQLAAETRRRITAVMGEAQVRQFLWICSAGYQPRLVSQRAGWNADFAAARIHELGIVELTRTDPADDRSCSANL